MNDQEISMAIQQKRALEGARGLSNVPYYIQELKHKLDIVSYKLDIVLKELQTRGTT